MIKLIPFWSQREFYIFLITYFLIGGDLGLEAGAATFLLALILRIVNVIIYKQHNYLFNLYNLFNLSLLISLMIITYNFHNMQLLATGLSLYYGLNLLATFCIFKKDSNVPLYHNFAHLNFQSEFIIDALNKGKKCIISIKEINRYVVIIFFVLTITHIAVYPLHNSTNFYIIFAFGLVPFIRMYLELFQQSRVLKVLQNNNN